MATTAERPRSSSRPVAVAFRGPGQVALVPEPEVILEPGQVRVRTLFSGISAGTELTAYRGTNVYLRKHWDPERRLFEEGEQTATYPVVGWGYSEVGEVTEVAEEEGATQLSPGDLVYGAWGHRSEVAVAAESIATQRLAAPLDPLAGVFARVGAIALNAVLAADVHVTETVVVVGQGVIGLLATRLAVLSGTRVVAVDRVHARLETATRLGAAHTVDGRAGDAAAGVQEVAPGGADVVVELSGAYPGLRDAIRCARPGGRVVAAGFYQGPATGLDLGEEFHHNRVTLVSAQIGGVPTAVSARWGVKRLHAAVLGLMADRRLDVLPLVSHLVPAADAAQAYRLLDESPETALQVVLDFRELAAHDG